MSGTRLERRPILDQRVAHVDERGRPSHANIVSTVLDFDQLAFIEKWRQRASRGVVIALDGTRGDIVVTIRAGELGERLDLRGKDATGAVRKARLSIGDRVTMAIEYTAKDLCLESKSLKLYLNSFRNEGVFCEALAVKIRDDVAEALGLDAGDVSVTLVQKARGGITITAMA